jgi:hypothetical protein
MKNAMTMGVLTLLVSAVPGYASTDPAATQPQVESVASNSLNLEGNLKCFYSRTGTFVQFVDFVKADGDSIAVSGPSDELKAQCAPAGQLSAAKLKVEGELTSRFLFWGGNLRVKNFQVSKN